MKRKLMMVSMMAILSLSLFACGSKDTTSSSNGSARTNTEKEADTKNENVGTFSQLFTNNEVGVWYSCEAIDKEETPSIYVLLGKAIGWAVGKVAGRGTQNAIQSTAHGVQRIAGTTATRGGVLSVNEVRVTKSVGKAFTQADGATVYLHEITPGRFNAVVEGRKGIITTMGNWSQKSINRIAKNYGWNIK